MHGKVGAVDLVVVEKELQKIRKAVNLYTNKNLYNRDEFALFWKMTLDRILGTKQSAKKKYEKVWITINLICNVSKSHKLKPWFIRRAIISCCFGRSSINIKNF